MQVNIEQKDPQQCILGQSCTFIMAKAPKIKVCRPRGSGFFHDMIYPLMATAPASTGRIE
jgi:hypothetical protein